MTPFTIVWTAEARAAWKGLDDAHKDQVRQLLAYLLLACGGGFFWSYTPAGRRLWYVSSREAHIMFSMNYRPAAGDDLIIFALGTASMPPLVERD